jgi:nitroimidazol reductase NimA-like FMN-containing flavoprotein (pyridoxamine 5'-phosphate oxidase superfamily)
MSRITILHPRRIERDMPDPTDQLDVIRKGHWISLAMCLSNDPYLVTLQYAYDEAEQCFYIHCAPEGRKVNILRANPRVWGQITEDHGYVPGKATFHYRSIAFQARAEFVDDLPIKRRSLELLLARYEPDPAARDRAMAGFRPETVTVLRLRVQAMSGKRNPAPR